MSLDGAQRAPDKIDRRQMLGAGLAVAALVATPLYLWQKVRQGEKGEATQADRDLLATICDLVIPATDTASASEVGVPEFIVLALNHGLDGTRVSAASAAVPQPGTAQRAGLGGMFLLDDLAIRLGIQAGGDFNAAAPERQRAALTTIDTRAFAKGGEADSWHQIKDLILTGYYTSEVGGSKELRYELVPGRWDADIPLRPGDRAFSSDWTAVDFG